MAKSVSFFLLLVIILNSLFFSVNLKCKNNEKNYNQPLVSKFLPYLISYFGGDNEDRIFFAQFDKGNNLIIAAGTKSNNLPTQNNSYQKNVKGDFDIYLTKLTLDGKVLWSTYFGGSSRESVFKMLIDNSNRIWLIGETNSLNFPTFGTNFIRKGSAVDGFVACFDSNGNLLFSTVLGGSEYDSFLNASLDDEYIYIVGRSFSVDFPTSPNAFQKNSISPGYDGVFLRVNLSTFDIYSTYFSLSSDYDTFPEAIATINGLIYIGGFTNARDFKGTNKFLNTDFKGIFDIWIAKFDKYFDLQWVGLYGGSGIDRISDMSFDSNGNLYILGFTNSVDLGFKNSFNGKMDAFILKLDTNGKIWDGFYLGGLEDDGKITNNFDFDRFWAQLFVSSKNDLLMVNFSTLSFNITTSVPSSYLTNNSGSWDSFSFVYDLNFAPYFSTFLGGSKNDYSNSINFTFPFLIISGYTSSPDFPITSNAFKNRLSGNSDGFLAIFTLAIDSLPPTVQSYSDSCGTIRFFECFESDFSSSGIKKVEPVKLDNCSLVIIDSTEKRVKIRISLVDKSQNGFYLVNIVDNAGNITTISDSIFFNSNYLLSFSPSDSLILPRSSFFERKCYDVKISNASSDTLKLGKLYFRRNVHFSIPPSQLPIILPPHDTVTVSICFAPEFELKGMYVDTLEISDTCFSKWLFVKASIDTAKYTAASNCGTLVNGSSVFLNKQPKVQVQYSDLNRLIITFIDFENEKKTIRILDLLGRVIFSRESYESFAELDLNFLSQGFYILRIEFSNNSYLSLPFLK
jgi:hypothetical protein